MVAFRADANVFWPWRFHFELEFRGSFLALVVVLECGGCDASRNGDSAHLQGSVLVNGAPLPATAQGSIPFWPTDPKGKPVTVQIVDGRYDSPQTPRGAIKVHFEISAPTGRKLKSERTGQEYDETKSLVPDQYAQGLELNVDQDNLSYDFSLD